MGGFTLKYTYFCGFQAIINCSTDVYSVLIRSKHMVFLHRQPRTQYWKHFQLCCVQISYNSVFRSTTDGDNACHSRAPSDLSVLDAVTGNCHHWRKIYFGNILCDHIDNCPGNSLAPRTNIKRPESSTHCLCGLRNNKVIVSDKVPRVVHSVVQIITNYNVVTGKLNCKVRRPRTPRTTVVLHVEP